MIANHVAADYHTSQTRSRTESVTELTVSRFEFDQ